MIIRKKKIPDHNLIPAPVGKYYHISKIDLGPNVILTAKIPDTALVAIEGIVPRVCFCPTLAGCLQGIAGIKGSVECLLELIGAEGSAHYPTIYATKDQLMMLEYPVSDFKETGEVWSISDIEVNRAGYLDLNQLLHDRILTIVDEPGELSKEVCDLFRTFYRLHCWRDINKFIDYSNGQIYNKINY